MTRKKRLNYDHLEEALRNPTPKKKQMMNPPFCFSLITSPFSLYRPKVVLGRMYPSSVQTLDECGRPIFALFHIDLEFFQIQIYLFLFDELNQFTRFYTLESTFVILFV